MAHPLTESSAPETISVDLREREKELDFVYKLAALLSGPDLEEYRTAALMAELFRKALSRPEKAYVMVRIHGSIASSPQGHVSDLPKASEEGLYLSAGEADSCLLEAWYVDPSPRFSEREVSLGQSAVRLLAIAARRMLSDHQDAALKQDLERKNATLSELLSRIELEKKGIRDSIAYNLKNRVLPILTQMDKAGVPGKWSAQLRHELGKAVAGQVALGLTLRSLLSPRELEICALVADGLTSKEISSRLGLAAATVERHRHNARRKLGLPARQGSLASLQLDTDL